MKDFFLHQSLSSFKTRIKEYFRFVSKMILLLLYLDFCFNVFPGTSVE